MSRRGRAWADRQEPTSSTGVLIATWRRYRDVDGPRQSLALTAYLVIAVLPALLVVAEYVEQRPRAFADHLVHHYALSAQTAELLRSVLVQDATHKLGSALFAIVGALFFGLGFGKVLQRLHARVWDVPVGESPGDQMRYVEVLLLLVAMVLLLVLQTSQIAGDPPWAGETIAGGWLVVLTAYFCWAPWILLHRRIALRDLLPGAILTAVGIVALMLLSSFAMGAWVDLYARDYGGFGVVMAIFFWIGFSTAVIVFGAAIGPALAHRRAARHAGSS